MNQPKTTLEPLSNPEVPPIADPPPATTPPAAAPAPAPSPAGLRLRLKVWTDPAKGTRYLVPCAFLTNPDQGVMSAYAIGTEEGRTIYLTPPEWNALPFFYFKEEGER